LDLNEEATLFPMEDDNVLDSLGSK
jgi:hypothetical protein